jgi:hypothetical protein
MEPLSKHTKEKNKFEVNALVRKERHKKTKTGLQWRPRNFPAFRKPPGSPCRNNLCHYFQCASRPANIKFTSRPEIHSSKLSADW